MIQVANNIRHIPKLNELWEQSLLDLLKLIYFNQCNTLVKHREIIIQEYLLKSNISA